MVALFVDDVRSAWAEGEWSLGHSTRLITILNQICREWFEVVETPRSHSRKRPVLASIEEGLLAIPDHPAATVYAIDYGLDAPGENAGRRRAADISNVYFSRLLRRPVRYDELYYPVLLIAIDSQRGAIMSLVKETSDNVAALVLASAIIATVIASLKQLSGVLSKEPLDDPLDRSVYLFALDYCLSRSGADDEFTSSQMASWFESVSRSREGDGAAAAPPPFLKRRSVSCALVALDRMDDPIGASCEHTLNRLCSMGYIAPVEAAGNARKTFRIKLK